MPDLQLCSWGTKPGPISLHPPIHLVFPLTNGCKRHWLQGFWHIFLQHAKCEILGRIGINALWPQWFLGPWSFVLQSWPAVRESICCSNQLCPHHIYFSTSHRDVLDTDLTRSAQFWCLWDVIMNQFIRILSLSSVQPSHSSGMSSNFLLVSFCHGSGTGMAVEINDANAIWIFVEWIRNFWDIN